MKTLIIILILAAFLQTTILPINLILIILICRAYIKTDPINLYLAFGFGLLISHLQVTTLGLQSVIYLLLIQLTHILSKSPLTKNSFLIMPVSLFLLSINGIASSFLIHQTLQIFPRVILESIISLPTLFLLRLWEERFIVKKEIKLKV